MKGPGSRYTRYSVEYQIFSPLHLPLQAATGPLQSGGSWINGLLLSADFADFHR
jgi:hypothetical protein